MRKATRINKKQRQLVNIIVFTNILEWYEIYAFAFLAPVLSNIFFNSSDVVNLFALFLTFGIGFLGRPIGALFFGRHGDLKGRKSTFILSLLIMMLPTVCIGFLPTYAMVGVWAPILLVTFRLFQAIPSAAEVPGSVCFLYENSDIGNRRFMASWAGVGNQIGAMLGIIEAFIIHKFFNDSFMETWGWRIVFWSGGAIGLFSLFLRKKLHETPVFQSMKSHHVLDKETIFETINNHKKNILLGTGFGVIDAVTFYLAAIYIPTFFIEHLSLGEYSDFIIAMFIIVFTTILIPIFGKIGDMFNNKLIMIASTILILFSLYPISVGILQHNLLLLGIGSLVVLISMSCLTALLAYQMAHLFPANIRFTGFGLSFNLSDGIFGGFASAISLLLVHYTGNPAAFCWFVGICAIISLISYFQIKTNPW